MEENKLFEMGFVEMNSSELQCRGGLTWDGFMDNVKAVVDFVVNYIPKLISGILTGWGLIK